MAHMMKPITLIFSLPLMMTAMAPAQTQSQRESLSVQGHSGQAIVIRSRGRVFVDVQGLAAIVNGSVSFNNGSVVLTLPGCEASEQDDQDANKTGFSRHLHEGSDRSDGLNPRVGWNP